MPSRVSPKLIRINRMMSWILLFFAVATIVTGYSLTRNRGSPLSVYPYHLWMEIGFVTIFIIHLVLSLVTPFYWKHFVHRIRKGTTTPRNWLKLTQRLTGWSMIALAFVVIISGVQWYGIAINEIIPFLYHLRVDLLLILLIIIHVAIGTKFALARRQIRGPWTTAFLLVLIIIPSLAVISVDQQGLGTDGPPDDGGEIPRAVRVTVGEMTHTFDPNRIETLRPDLFQPGHFSIFDILVYLGNTGQIDLTYHFAPEMNTYAVDSINGHPHWWFYAYYDGGWRENNIFRMDHYPWKEHTTIVFFQEEENLFNVRYSIFRVETTRRGAMGSEIIIPEVRIRGYTFDQTYTDVRVTPHNLRNDTFQLGVITAIDVIMSLGDRGLISYDLQYYSSIGEYAGIVQSYWVEGINDDLAYGGCGFVYEEGSHRGATYGGNHIHIPSDWRILNAPEYMLWFWICL